MDPPQKQRFLPELSESETESEAESEVSCILETGEEQLEINQRPEEPVAKILKKPVPQNLKKRRWDLVPEADIHEDKNNNKYKSWRRYKRAIIESLQASGGDVGFVRRYLLYHHRVSLPRNIIYYYNSCYRIESPTNSPKKRKKNQSRISKSKQCSKGASSSDISYPVCDLPANSSAGGKAIYNQESHL
ncbi:p22k [California sea lion adenovirus 1]|uniref:p22k n=1 Tax=California sea lion adenovirus 1 TaxID=943083 RepID=A0A059XN72_9ADEN|nr:p22k [California sea lion adenovirus 1]AIA22362.1 p22k [California sea lion adenovirus 1]